VIDLGPEGGSADGRIVAEGPPEAVARVAESHTGRCLAQMLGITPEPEAPAPVAAPSPDGAKAKAVPKRGRKAKTG
jgi:excinuclease ABC subunit A